MKAIIFGILSLGALVCIVNGLEIHKRFLYNFPDETRFIPDDGEQDYNYHEYVDPIFNDRLRPFLRDRTKREDTSAVPENAEKLIEDEIEIISQESKHEAFLGFSFKKKVQLEVTLVASNKFSFAALCKNIIKKFINGFANLIGAMGTIIQAISNVLGIAMGYLLTPYKDVKCSGYNSCSFDIYNSEKAQHEYLCIFEQDKSGGQQSGQLQEGVILIQPYPVIPGVPCNRPSCNRGRVQLQPVPPPSCTQPECQLRQPVHSPIVCTTPNCGMPQPIQPPNYKICTTPDCIGKRPPDLFLGPKPLPPVLPDVACNLPNCPENYPGAVGFPPNAIIPPIDCTGNCPPIMVPVMPPVNNCQCIGACEC